MAPTHRHPRVARIAACPDAWWHCDCVAQVDPQDESSGGWIVQRHRYDPQRYERRKVTEIAYDNQVEFEGYLDEARARLVREKAEGLAEPVERYLGTFHEPGHREAMRRRRGQARR
jgi:hypothetical protein